MNIIQASLKYKQVTVSVLLLLFVIGVQSLLNMPRREDPKITIRTGLVVAYYPGANSSQVEDQVTKKTRAVSISVRGSKQSQNLLHY